MVGVNPHQSQLPQPEIWGNDLVLHFLRIHQYLDNLNALNKGKVYWRAESYRWFTHNLYKLHKGGTQMPFVPKPQE